jgi:hypothetical protein
MFDIKEWDLTCITEEIFTLEEMKLYSSNQENTENMNEKANIYYYVILLHFAHES